MIASLGRAVLGSWLIAAGAPALAHDGQLDQERALEALEAGEIVPLHEILDELHTRYRDGTVLELELDQKDGRWVYEVEVLGNDGRLREVYLDAKTKETLREEER